MFSLVWPADTDYPQKCNTSSPPCHAAVRWFPPSLGKMGGPPSRRDESSGAEPADMTALDVRQFLLEYNRQKELAEGIGAEDEEEEEPGNDV